MLRRFYNLSVIRPPYGGPIKLVTAGAALIAGVATATTALVAATAAQNTHTHDNSHDTQKLAH